MNLVKNLDKLLIVYGCKLDSNSGNFISLLIALIYYAWNANLIISIAILLANGIFGPNILLWLATYYTYVYIHVIIVKNKRSLVILLRNIQFCVTPDLAPKLDESWRLSLAAVAIFYVLEFSFSLLYYYEEEFVEKVFSALMHFDVSVHKVAFYLAAFPIQVLYTNVWAFVSFVVYNYILTCIDCVHYSFFNHEMSRNKSIQTLRRKWFQVSEIREKFERVFSLLPLLWFANLFMKTMTYMNTIRLMEFRMKLLTAIYVYFFVSKLMYTFYIVFKVDNINHKLSEMFKKVHKRSLSYRNDEFELLRQDIAATLYVHLTGFGLFALNKELLLGFVSAVISFTILYLQLTQ